MKHFIHKHVIILEFRKTMEIQTEQWVALLESSLGKIYEKNNLVCQEKLQELYAILGRISKFIFSMI